MAKPPPPKVIDAEFRVIRGPRVPAIPTFLPPSRAGARTVCETRPRQPPPRHVSPPKRSGWLSWLAMMAFIALLAANATKNERPTPDPSLAYGGAQGRR